VSYTRFVLGTDPRAAEILRFWFGADLLDVPQAPQKRWFTQTPAFDAEVLTRFVAVYQEAVAGALVDWQHGPLRCLAYLILLDQFPRNMFRDSAKAFATDYLALEAARKAVAQRFDEEVPPLARAFFYLPFEHSEVLADQDECLRLFQQWRGEPQLAGFLAHAVRHREVIERFGRFPHRNSVLGRESSKEEVEFLQRRRGSAS
jgi:uncharacterized protein (DUF924 family)